QTEAKSSLLQPPLGPAAIFAASPSLGKSGFLFRPLARTSFRMFPRRARFSSREQANVAASWAREKARRRNENFPGSIGLSCEISRWTDDGCYSMRVGRLNPPPPLCICDERTGRRRSVLVWVSPLSFHQIESGPAFWCRPRTE